MNVLVSGGAGFIQLGNFVPNIILPTSSATVSVPPLAMEVRA